MRTVSGVEGTSETHEVDSGNGRRLIMLSRLLHRAELPTQLLKIVRQEQHQGRAVLRFLTGGRAVRALGAASHPGAVDERADMALPPRGSPVL